MYIFGHIFALIIRMKKIAIVNGPNLNLLGKREPEIYGHESFESYLEKLKAKYEGHDIQLDHFQSNVEGELINFLQQIDGEVEGILLNAGGYTHTSVAIADAVAAIKTPVLEIHISQPKAREKERHISLLEKYCHGTISGLGLNSYELGIEYFNLTLNTPNQ